MKVRVPKKTLTIEVDAELADYFASHVGEERWSMATSALHQVAQAIRDAQGAGR